MIAHIIGNGPSKAHFKNVPEGKVFGCNFASEDLDLVATFIHDNRVFEHIIRHNMKLKWPVINRDTQFRRFGNCGGRITVKDTYYPNPGESTCSSGHMALLWFLSKGYNEIHIWGFDSLTSSIVDSDSKGKIDGSNPNAQLLPKWKARFDEIFAYCKKYGKKVYIHKDEKNFISI
jgi:hypothetical protein